MREEENSTTQGTTMNLPAKATTGDVMESVLIAGDLAKLTQAQRVDYYNATCKSLGLNPLTKPFDYITLNGKLQLYALRACTDQLRKINGISLEIVSREVTDGILTVHARARTPDGRSDEDFGSVPFPDTLKGEFRANMEMKCVTKAKRRATLSICGLGWLDETEVEDIPSARREFQKFEELNDEISSSDEPAPAFGQVSPRGNPSEMLLFTMAVEKAKQGEVVLNEWFKEQSKEAKAWLREHKAELVALYPK
jgi:hypothetical protein